MVCMYDGRKGGCGGEVGLALSQNLYFAFACFNCETRAGSRINVDLRVLQTVTPRGCGNPVYAGYFVILDAA